MNSKALVPGVTYAYRRKQRGPLTPVVFLGLAAPKKAHLRFEGGEERDENVRFLVCPWTEAPVLLADEERLDRIEAYNTERHHYRDSPEDIAAMEALAASGEDIGSGGMFLDTYERLAPQLGLSLEPTELHPLAFVDRHDEVHFPVEAGVILARAFTARHPAEVEFQIADLERRYADVASPWRAGLRLARQWIAEAQAVSP